MSFIFKGGTEPVHEKLYRAHNHLAFAAHLIHEVIAKCVESSRYKDDREAIKAVLEQLNEALDLADRSLETAGRARSDLFGLTGCDGTCSEAARKDSP